jgi:hypothetical protein
MELHAVRGGGLLKSGTFVDVAERIGCRRKNRRG